MVPHVSARLVADDAHLADIVATLTACGVDDVFVPAGDAEYVPFEASERWPTAWLGLGVSNVTASSLLLRPTWPHSS